MNKPTFEISLEEVVEIDTACFEACCQCPGYYPYTSENTELELLKNRISKVSVMSKWADDQTLFYYGYSDYLDDNIIDKLYDFRIYKAQVDRWNRYCGFNDKDKIYLEGYELIEEDDE